MNEIRWGRKGQRLIWTVRRSPLKLTWLPGGARAASRKQGPFRVAPVGPWPSHPLSGPLWPLCEVGILILLPEDSCDFLIEAKGKFWRISQSWSWKLLQILNSAHWLAHKHPPKQPFPNDHYNKNHTALVQCTLLGPISDALDQNLQGGIWEALWFRGASGDSHHRDIWQPVLEQRFLNCSVREILMQSGVGAWCFACLTKSQMTWMQLVHPHLGMEAL